MKAQVFYKAEKMHFEDRDLPQIGDQEILVKVKACGICGSDIAYYYGRSPLETETGEGPLILGHEFSGEVVQLGNYVKLLNLFKEGDKVVANPVQCCNSCRMCIKGNFNLCENSKVIGVSVDGAFAEYVKIRYTNVIKLPEDISFEEAALIEPLSCATYAVRNANIDIGDFTVVFGPGSIGLMMIQLIKSIGAGKIVLVGTRDYPLELGRMLGANFIFNIKDENSKYFTNDLLKEINTLTDFNLADRVLVATSSIQAAQSALLISGAKSNIVFFGLGGPEDVLKVPMLDTLTGDKRLIFSWLAPNVWPYSIKALSTGKVKLDKIITHRFPLEKLEEAIIKMSVSKENKMKGVIVF